jgi:hypothetical protein
LYRVAKVLKNNELAMEKSGGDLSRMLLIFKEIKIRQNVSRREVTLGL